MTVKQFILPPGIILCIILPAACMLLSSCNAAKSIDRTENVTSAFEVKADSDGKCWFFDPQGEKFLSIGINHVVAKPFRPKPGSQYYAPVQNQFGGNFDDWKEDVFKIFKNHGFNTIGCWSDGGLYDVPLYGTVCLYVASHAADRCLEGLRPGFESRVRDNIKLTLKQYPYLDNTFGVFLDNEMPWYGHAPWGDIPNYTLLEKALSLPNDDLARHAAVNFLKQRYPSVQAFSDAWGKPLASWDNLTFEYARSCMNDRANQDRQAFIDHAAEAFYKISSKVAREMLPGKLILGTRFAGYAPEPVIRACGRYSDVVSFNDYRSTPLADPDMLARFWLWCGRKPIMITEYAWRAEQNTSGNRNTSGGGTVVKTQADRANNYKKYVEDLLSYPMVVGAHWFEFADQSPQGRFDGENSNYGVVDIHHRPYRDVLNAMKQTNSGIEKLHAASQRKAPISLPKPKAVVFQPGQYPERPPFIDLLKMEQVQQPALFNAADAVIQAAKRDGSLGLTIDTGNEWGCGILFFGPKEFRNPSGPAYSTDLDGYSVVEIDAVIGKGVVFDLLLEESGIDKPNAASYNTSAGDDGEGFIIPANKGQGGRFLYRFELKDLQPRKDWGNQKGARKVDMHAMKGVALFFHGGQGKDDIRIFSVRFDR
jgi:agarase